MINSFRRCKGIPGLLGAKGKEGPRGERGELGPIGYKGVKGIKVRTTIILIEPDDKVVFSYRAGSRRFGWPKRR